MLSALFVLDGNSVLLQKEYVLGIDYRSLLALYCQAHAYADASQKGDRNSSRFLGLNRSKVFDSLVLSVQETNPSVWLSPIIFYEEHTICNLKHNELTVLGIAERRTANCALLFKALQLLVSLCKDFFGSFTRQSLSQNFIQVNQIIDEAIVSGVIQQNDPKMISQFLSSDPTTATAYTTPLNTAVPWRSSNIKYSRNEIFVDVIESVEAIVNPTGEVVKKKLTGSIHMKSLLSGMPELKLGLYFSHKKTQLPTSTSSELLQFRASQPVLEECILSEKLQDVRFHQCVRLNRFETNKVITFIPPDGDFELLSYTINNKYFDKLPITVRCNYNPSCIAPDSSLFEVNITLQPNFSDKVTARFITLRIPTPSDVIKPKYKFSHGSASYKPNVNCSEWHLGLVTGQTTHTLSITANRSRAGRDPNERWHATPLMLLFEIPFYTASNIQVEYLKISESSGYMALPWVRYVTKSGEFLIRPG